MFCWYHHYLGRMKFQIHMYNLYFSTGTYLKNRCICSCGTLQWLPLCLYISRRLSAVEGPEGGASGAELGRINISTIFDIEQQSGTASPKIENYWELSLGAEGRFTLFNKRFHKCRLCPEPRHFMEWNCMLKAEHWDQEVSQLLPQIEQLVLQEYLIFQRSPDLIEQRALIGISTLSTTLGTQFLEWPIESSYYF